MINLNKKNQLGNNNGESKNHMKHGLLMMLCCLLPIVIIAGLPLFGIRSGILSSLAFLICPLMHVGMILMMRKSGNSGTCCGDKNNSANE
ncbi:hypothetical protein SAMN02745945_00071 [Peptoclostridium litorale DSM 5388]|uniref:DUF2933 domain-containing protein n=1 Tax=Peptoclostridium litorale DSM 5388 TaxID=1121324 RepID=A0A069RR82_PEPLI|nr:hypothetical protein [Peptoclostridium litorale]KDR96677.1 hypothetical protein CLIT_2c02830 [Peptoclostridium litorale DSM 5388]SIN67819.1 hypothetical protein SAMN02745945_00071 [Peptoclostridium litorale DSM 5388]